MKKTLLMGLILFFYNFLTIPAYAETLKTGKQVELTQIVTKDFIYHALEGWIRYDLFSYYSQHYNSQKTVIMEPRSTKEIKIFLKPITTTHSPGYTHIVKVQFPNLEIKLGNTKNIIVIDTLLYAVNVNHLTNYADSNAMGKSVNLLDHTHKEIKNNDL